MVEIFIELQKNCIEIDSDIVDMVNEHFWDLI
jgi:hypothetical protein